MFFYFLLLLFYGTGCSLFEKSHEKKLEQITKESEKFYKEWFSYKRYKTEMLSLFKEANKETDKDIEKKLKLIELGLKSHLKAEHKKINQKLDQILEKINQNRSE